MHLKPNTELQNGKYRIERVLGQGGFGMVYLAEDTFLAATLYNLLSGTRPPHAHRDNSAGLASHS